VLLELQQAVLSMVFAGVQTDTGHGQGRILLQSSQASSLSSVQGMEGKPRYSCKSWSWARAARPPGATVTRKAIGISGKGLSNE